MGTYISPCKLLVSISPPAPIPYFAGSSITPSSYQGSHRVRTPRPKSIPWNSGEDRMWLFKSKQKFTPASASSYTRELVQPLKAEAVDERREADRGYVASNYQVVQPPQEK